MIMERKAFESKLMLGAIIGLVLSASLGAAQTTLSGDHVVAGNLSVGTSATKGNLNVIGQVGTGAGKSLNVTGDGQVVLSGALGVGPGSLTAQAQPAFIWIPSKAAIRFGESLPADSNIGVESFAFGSYSEAREYNSIAGAGAIASGIGSVAFAGGVAEGELSFAAAAGHAGAVYSSAFGGYVDASAEWSSAFAGGYAAGAYSVAVTSGGAYGHYSFAANSGYSLGEHSFAVMGGAYGQNCVAIGKNSISESMYCVTVGSYSAEGNYSLDAWVPTDPIFIVSNGSGKGADPLNVRQSDALRVLKNGNVIIPKRQGDVLMGEFGNPE
ncbi:MAG: hypothetical protein BGO12_09735 [Verrucomicrobia bacterium 61-8]|nr:MAG: hypothetical protein BGO12_09735 [Verrucomicrobia bacterium 61-8]